MDNKKNLDRAKVALLNKGSTAFIATILFSLKFSWSEELPTAGTDGLKLVINPEFFKNLTAEERVFLLAHEAWHVAFQHMLRMTPTKKANFRIWNMACDYNINMMLVKAGFKMIEGGLYDDKYENLDIWSADKIFEDLMQKDEEDQSKQEQDFNEDFELPEDMTPEEVQDLERQVEDVIIKASVQAKMKGEAGHIPSEIAISLDELLNPKLAWNVILQKYVSSYAKEDYSWRRPNRRYTSQGIILPSMYSEKVDHIAIAVDTSCSVSDEQFNMFIAEIADIKRKLNPELLTVVDFDTSIKKVHKIKATDDIRSIQFTGRGGTYLHPVFEHFEKNKPKVLLVFSDLECEEVTTKPDYDVIWLKLEGYGFTPSFGKLIELKE